MPVTIFSPMRSDKTISIAFAMVAVLGAAEVLAVGWHFVAKARSARQANTAAAVISTPTPAAPTTAATAAPPAQTTAQSTPSNAALSVAERLLKEATQLREQGDTNNALARLQDASQRDPKNANVLAEMAMIYESIGSLDRSNETWRKIADIGPSAGALWELADMKLKMGVAPPAKTTGPGFAGVSPLDAGTTRADPEGIPDGSNFGITEASTTENPDPESETNLTLRVGVKKRPNTVT
ncbi:MAG: tetratricopeptide repeat protein, partial [Verrucomicrobiota bacterium]|nr:tetratricopeptide repeat protein [Verrucomicrobiota bacterium]